MARLRFTLIYAVITLGTALAAHAQPAPDVMRASLEGLPAFTLYIDVEGSSAVAESEPLDVTALTGQVLQHLQDAGLPASAPAQAAPEGSVPYLYIHVNTMEFDQGLVPFAVQAQFFQPARLVRDQSFTTAAGTWETGVVGLVSQDRLPLIRESVLNLTASFIEDFQAANR